MNRLQLQTALASATTSTFEELALVCGDLATDRERAAEPLVGGVSVEFAGPMRGALVLRVTAGALDAAAANMLALDGPPAEALRRDALGEVANVICGTLLPELAGSRAEFSLRAPRWLDAHVHAAGDVAVEACVPLEDGRAEVALYLEAPEPAGGADAR
ncbi:MAG TPA: chemotaxis protein CheX [Gemmatimonadales bacterium]